MSPDVRSFAVRARLSRLALIFAPALAACAGSGNDDLFAESGTSEGNDTSGTDPLPPAETPAKPGTKTSPPATNDPGTPQPDVAKCTAEIEKNDDEQHATPFETSFCGKIGGFTDTDWASFEVPKDANGVHVSTSTKGGRATFRYYVQGEIIATNVQELQAIPGEKYLVQVRLDNKGGSTGPVSYQLDVSFK
jgi:hypothetical protein